MEDGVVLAFEALAGKLVGDILFPLLGGLELLPSLLAPLLELPPVPLDDNTILSGGTLSPLPAAEPGAPSVPDDFPETFEELSLSSFSLSEWSRL